MYLFYLVFYLNEGGNPDGFPLKLPFPSDINEIYLLWGRTKPDEVFK